MLLLFYLTVCLLVSGGAGEAMTGSAGDALAYLQVRDTLDISWAHRVNSQAELKQALDDGTDFLEADVLMEGQGTENQTDTVIMAHPPDIRSDLTLEDFLNVSVPSGRGIKLDFKTMDAVKPALSMLKNYTADIKQPVWINADVFKGPGGGEGRNGSIFVKTVNQIFPRCTLSLGWTVDNGEDAKLGYTWAHVREAAEFSGGLEQPVTFPVFAPLLRLSWERLAWLLQQSDRYSLTVWSHPSYPVNASDMVHVRTLAQPSQIYFDIPTKDVKEIKRLEAAAPSSASPLFSTVQLLFLSALLLILTVAIAYII